MTNKEKIKAYRKAAELINQDMFLGIFDACSCSNINRSQDCWVGIIYQQWVDSGYDGRMTQELRETILLSCAELVRLEFEIE